MLQVFDAENCRTDIVDIDASFSKLEIMVNDAVKNIIKAVDAGNMIDESTFEDRFGVRLYLSELSTGCKAAICGTHAGADDRFTGMWYKCAGCDF